MKPLGSFVTVLCDSLLRSRDVNKNGHVVYFDVELFPLLTSFYFQNE